MAVSRGYHFYQNPGPTNIPDRILRAMDRGTIDFTGAAVQGDFRGVLRRAEAGLQDRRDDPRLCRLRAWRLGGGAGQSVLAGRQGAGRRERLFLAQLGYAGRSFRARGRDPAQRLAPRRRPGQARSAGCARIASTRSRRCSWCTTRPRPGSLNDDRRAAPRDRRGAAPGALPASTRSRRSARWISAWTNGASTSSSPARRKG